MSATMAVAARVCASAGPRAFSPPFLAARAHCAALVHLRGAANTQRALAVVGACRKAHARTQG
eukprot:6386484-Alexandrium_andersonii.AAC.1